MKEIQVCASKEYRIKIDFGILSNLGQEATLVTSGRLAAVVSDDTVSALYGDMAAASLTQAGFEVCTFSFPHGESSKNGTTYFTLLNFLAEHHLSRSDLIVALGGGVTGDLAGFAAATYLRGIPYIQVPTTLLAMVDSSVGGKTAIDLPAGKNLAGAFYQPSLVLCDLSLLDTLPPSVFLDGSAEVIKYAILDDKEFFFRILSSPIQNQLKDVVARCVTIKSRIVAQDEFDRGNRQLLNLGHTIGHSVELASGYQITHGLAVSIGMAVIARAACTLGFCSPETARTILGILKQYNLPIHTQLPKEALLAAAHNDKKRLASHMTLVVPTDIGSCLLHRIAVDELPSWLEAGLKEEGLWT